MLTDSKLRSLLSYNPTTGVFTWLVDGRNQHQRAGAKAGCLAPDGRYKIGIEGKRYLGSRLAVLYMTGQWPPRLVDHINLDASDNRWCNLRDASSSENLHNMRAKNGRVGLKGVVFDPYTGRYRARIKVHYKNLHLGRFDTAEEAHAAYVAAAKMYYGEFARAK
jgi:hypothetical protein